MNATCSHCGANFEPEPGFYYGAMFVSYALNVVLLVAISLTLYVAGNPSDWMYIAAIALGAVLFTPACFRYSRIFFLYMFGGIHYDPQQGKPG